MVKMVTLVENHANEPLALDGEHGFSLYIEANDKKILFDTGQTELLLDNAEALGVSLHDLDMIVLSHGHYDHTGGIIKLLRETGPGPDIFVAAGFFEEKYHFTKEGIYQYNGIPFTKEDLWKAAGGKVCIIDGLEQAVPHYVTKHISLISNFTARNDFEKIYPRFFLKTRNGYEKDSFRDEQALVIETRAGLIVVCGCSHAGIVNIMARVGDAYAMPVRGILGGTHLAGTKQERVENTIAKLKSLNLEFLAVSHCTGDENTEVLQEAFGNRFYRNITGSRMEF